MDETQLESEVYYQYQQIIVPDELDQTFDLFEDGSLDSLEETFDTTLGSAEASVTGVKTDTYIKSEYAPAYGVEVARSFQNLSNPFIHAGDTIEVSIALKNTSDQTVTGVEYLDMIPAIFSSEHTTKYKVTLGDEVITRDFAYIEIGEYDAHFVGRDIPAGKTLTITYELQALPASYGEMLVGDFENGEIGHDLYGDVGFKNSTTC